ncbi:hypothetical protein [Pseudopedobacter sp.]|uniref:hypothetical protein n=1 Tax=Pseudopedobacter sp. TaxID=1936787 RepID=UPI0033427D7E
MLTENSIKFKTTGVVKNLLIGIVFIIALIGIALLVSDRFRIEPWLASVILLAIGAAISFGVSYVSNDETTLYTDDEHLYFSTETSLVYNVREKVLRKNEVKCFEITSSKLYDYLVFYFFDKKPYVIVLGRNNINFISEIEKTLKLEGIRSLKDSKFISEFSFSEVFKKSFFHHLFFGIALVLIQTFTILFYKFVLHEVYQITITSMVISAILIWFLYNKYFKREWGINIKWHSIFGSCYLTTFFSLILIGLCSKPFHTIISNPVHVRNISEIQNNKSNRFFIIDKFDFRRNRVGFYQSHSKNTKSGKHSINNVFSVPFKDQQSPKSRYSYWASLSYKHSFKKAVTPDYLIQLKRNDFEKFKNIMDHKIEFFELIHHDPEGMLKDKLSLKSVESTRRFAAPLYIFKPETESFEVYKQNKTEFLLLFMMGLVFVSVLNGFIYAKSR